MSGLAGITAIEGRRLIAALKRRGELEGFLEAADAQARELRGGFGNLDLFSAWRLIYAPTPGQKVHEDWLHEAKESFIKRRALDILRQEHGR
jgi:hypothetical protein